MISAIIVLVMSLIALLPGVLLLLRATRINDRFWRRYPAARSTGRYVWMLRIYGTILTFVGLVLLALFVTETLNSIYSGS